MTFSPGADRDIRAPHALSIRPEAATTPASGIAEVFAYGQGRQGLLALWVGESDMPTAPHVAEAAAGSIRDGETFYPGQRGHPAFRAAVAHYLGSVYADAPSAAWFASPDRIVATIGGMHALQIAMRLVAGVGDEVVVLAPAWPNFAGAAMVSGARPVEVPLAFVQEEGRWRWRLDAERLRGALTPATRALVINTPANPTGWTATGEEIAAILELARAHDLWIIADEIYGRFVYDRVRAPSFRDIMEPQDKILFVQTMSKNWAMTGWRVGWLEAPAALGPIIENLIQYSTSGVPLFTQRGAIAALDGDDATFQALKQRAAASRDVLANGLGNNARVKFALPEGAFYFFFAVEGCDDTRAAALRLVDEAGLGLAPGTAFGPRGQGFFRLCFARDPAQIGEATRRLQRWLAG